MKLPDEDRAVPDIAHDYAAHFDAGDRLFLFVSELMRGVRFTRLQRIHMCVAPVLTRVLRLHYVVHKLARVGLASEAKMAVRAIFENVVNLHALEQSGDREEYARRWIAWDLISFMRQVEAEVRLHPHNEPLFADHRRIAVEVERGIREEAAAEAARRWPGNAARAEKFVDGRWKQFRGHGPSMKDMRTLAEGVDFSSDPKSNFLRSYDFFYPNASAVIHGSDLSSLIEVAGTQVVLKLAPVPDEIETVLMTSNTWLMMGASSGARVLNIGPADAGAQMDAIVRPTVAHLLARVPAAIP